MAKRFFIVLIFVAHAVSARAAEVSAFEEIDQCLFNIKSSYSRYLGRLPLKVISIDRNLFQMTRAVFFMEDGYELLKKIAPQTAVSSSKRHLVNNAVQGCENFRAQFEARARRFITMIALISAQVVILTLWLVLNMVLSRRKRLADPKAFVPGNVKRNDQQTSFPSDSSG